MTAVEDSLRRLQTDYIDLYQIQRLDPETDIEETLSAPTDLVRRGKVRVIGSSTTPVSGIVEAPDSLHGSGVRVPLVRPGFVIGRMTQGMAPAPLATTPAAVGQAVAKGLGGRRNTVWVPPALAVAAVALRVVPRPLWRRIPR